MTPAMIDSMFYVGETPWHKEGVALDKPPTISEALIASGLDWNVMKEPNFIKLNINGKVQEVFTNAYTTVRTDKMQPLGTVKGRYEILQNIDAFSVFEPMLDMGFELETGGAIEDGKKVWILARSPQNLLVGDDAIQKFVLLYTSHDGSSGSCWRDTGIRTVCKNTIDFALSSKASFNYNLRHTSSIKDRVKAIKQNLVKSEGNFKEAIEVMNKWTEVKMNEESLDIYLETVVPYLKTRFKESVPEMGVFVRNRAKPVYEKMKFNFYAGKGNNGKTLWDAYNAVTEYYTHDKEYKDWVKQTQFGAGYNYKIKAFQVAEKWANVSKKVITSA